MTLLEDLGELDARVRGNGSATTGDFLRLIALVQQTVAQHQDVRNELEDALRKINNWKATAVDELEGIHATLDPIEQRLLIVGTLPPEEKFGALIRRNTGTVAQQAPLYLGNGPGQPLSKLTPVAV